MIPCLTTSSCICKACFSIFLTHRLFEVGRDLWSIWWNLSWSRATTRCPGPCPGGFWRSPRRRIHRLPSAQSPAQHRIAAWFSGNLLCSSLCSLVLVLGALHIIQMWLCFHSCASHQITFDFSKNLISFLSWLQLASLAISQCLVYCFLAGGCLSTDYIGIQSHLPTVLFIIMWE